MRESTIVQGNAAMSGRASLLMRFLGKLVLEILPAAMASVIGGFVFAHYQFERPADRTPAAPAVAAAPASPDMVRLVRDEHAMLREFLAAQTAAAEKRIAVADAQDARAETAAKRAEDASRRAAVTVATAKRPAPYVRKVAESVVASAIPAAPAAATAPAAPLALANAQPSAALALVVAPAPRPPSLVGETIAVKDEVLSVAGHAVHAVMAIGGIPSWIGRRLDGGLRAAIPLSGPTS